MKKLLLAVSAALSLAYAALVGGPMDGTVWEVKVKSEALFSLSRRDTMVFQNGRLSVAGFLSSGFTPAVYRSESARGHADQVWNAALTHVEKGIVTWSGLVRGDMIEGVAVWWTKDGKPRHFSFRGVRKTA